MHSSIVLYEEITDDGGIFHHMRKYFMYTNFESTFPAKGWVLLLLDQQRWSGLQLIA